MKIKKIVYYILMFLPLTAALAALQYLPDKIPAHYGFDGQIDRWGSKYESLIYPLAAIFMGYYLLAMAKRAAKQEQHGTNNENVIIIAGVFVLALFNALNGYALYADFRKVENLSSVPVDMIQLVFGMTGVLMVVLGNIMSKLRMNSIAGLRTRWSVKNETVWKKCQRLGGISFMISGIAIIGICIFVKGTLCLFAVLGVWAVLITVDIFVTYKIAEKNG